MNCTDLVEKFVSCAGRCVYIPNGTAAKYPHFTNVRTVKFGDSNWSVALNWIEEIRRVYRILVRNPWTWKNENVMCVWEASVFNLPRIVTIDVLWVVAMCNSGRSLPMFQGCFLHPSSWRLNGGISKHIWKDRLQGFNYPEDSHLHAAVRTSNFTKYKTTGINNYI